MVNLRILRVLIGLPLFTLLHFMAIYKFDKLIVENVKDKNPEDSYRRTPFYYAIKKGHSLVANFVESIALVMKGQKCQSQENG